MQREKTSFRRTAPIAVCLLLVGLIWFCFGSTLSFGFVNYDDNYYVYDNPHVRNGLSLSGIKWALTHIHYYNWHPLTTISHMADSSLYGLRTAGHHFTNVLCHTIASILLLLVLWRMTAELWRSAFVAAVFAVHPLHVESVAWISGRKDVLSGVFFALTLAGYYYYVRQRSAVRYLIVLVIFGLGLMCKPTLVTLPFVLLLLDYWPLRRFRSDSRREFNECRSFVSLVLEKLPLFILSMASCVAAVIAQRRPLEPVPFTLRIGNAVVSYLVYLRQTFYPVGLAPFYPFEELKPSRVIISFLLVLGVTIAAFLIRKKRPAVLVGWLWYVGMLVPMIGLVQISDHAHADRYTYLSQIGLVIAIAWGTVGKQLRYPVVTRLALIGGVLCIAMLAVVSGQQAHYWHDGETLWRHAISTTPPAPIPYNNLAFALYSSGHADDAIVYLKKALAMRPEYPEAHNNLGVVLWQKHAIDQGITEFREALSLRPNYSEAHSNLGLALLQSGDFSESAREFELAIGADKTASQPHSDLAVVLIRENQSQEAVAHYRKAIELDPGNPLPQNNLAWLLATSPDSSIRNGTEALTLAQKANEVTKGKHPAVLDSLAAAYAEQGRFEEAVKIAATAKELAASQKNGSSLVPGIEDRLRLYEKHSPYREESGDLGKQQE